MTEKAGAFLDLSGVACPMNAARALLKLETMPPGAILEIIIDDGEPRASVPATLAEEGHAVISAEKIDGDHWRLLIRRA